MKVLATDTVALIASTIMTMFFVCEGDTVGLNNDTSGDYEQMYGNR